MCDCVTFPRQIACADCTEVGFACVRSFQAHFAQKGGRVGALYNFENPKRFADVIMMRTRNGDTLGLLILENQDSADYSIPVQIFHEEAL